MIHVNLLQGLAKHAGVPVSRETTKQAARDAARGSLVDHGVAIIDTHFPGPALSTLLAIIIEIGGGSLMPAGYQTRLVSLGLAIYVLASAFIGHSQLDDPNQFMHLGRDLVAGAVICTISGA